MAAWQSGAILGVLSTVCTIRTTYGNPRMIVRVKVDVYRYWDSWKWDKSQLLTPMYNRPITSTYPASRYVGIDQSITYGSPGGSIINHPSGNLWSNS